MDKHEPKKLNYNENAIYNDKYLTNEKFLYYYQYVMKIFSQYFTEKFCEGILKTLSHQFKSSLNDLKEEINLKFFLSQGFRNLHFEKNIVLNIEKCTKNKFKILHQSNTSNFSISVNQSTDCYATSKQQKNNSIKFFSPYLLIPFMAINLNLISEKDKNNKINKIKEELGKTKRSLSLVDNFYCIKADEMNKPVFFAKENNKELNTSKEKQVINENHRFKLSNIETSNIVSKLKLNENMSDHLGNNVQIESFFEEYDNKNMTYEQLFHNTKNELSLIKPLIYKNKSLREAVFEKLSKGSSEKYKILLVVYRSLLTDTNVPPKIMSKSESFPQSLNYNESKPKIIEHSSSKTKLPYISLLDSNLHFPIIYTPDNKGRKFSFTNSFSNYPLSLISKTSIKRELGIENSRNNKTNQPVVKLTAIQPVNKNKNI